MGPQRAPVDPWTAGFNALGAAAGGPFVGGAAESATYGTTTGGAGWVVNMGGAQVAGAGTGSGISPLMIATLAAAALVGLAIFRRKG